MSWSGPQGPAGALGTRHVANILVVSVRIDEAALAMQLPLSPLN